MRDQKQSYHRHPLPPHRANLRYRNPNDLDNRVHNRMPTRRLKEYMGLLVPCMQVCVKLHKERRINTGPVIFEVVLMRFWLNQICTTHVLGPGR
eukprot:865382-Amorphochlora_amoeboformis.AAC.1